MGIIKTSVGIFAGVTAKDIFDARKRAKDPVDRIILGAAGSVAAATSAHLIKDEVVEAVQEFKGNKKLIEHK